MDEGCFDGIGGAVDGGCSGSRNGNFIVRFEIGFGFWSMTVCCDLRFCRCIIGERLLRRRHLARDL